MRSWVHRVQKEDRIHRHDGFRARLQRIERQEAHVRRAIDDDVVIVASDPREGVGQHVLPPGEPCQHYATTEYSVDAQWFPF